MTSRFAELLDRLPAPLRRVAVAALRPVVRGAVRHPIAPPAVRRFLWYSIGTTFAWEPHDYTARTRAGVVMRGNTQDLLEQYLYYFGVWEPDITAWMQRRLSPGDVFVDVGANVGYYSLLAADRVGPWGSVVAIEASPDLHRRLVANVEANHATNVRTLHLVADRAPGLTPVYDGPAHHRGLTTVVPDVDDETLAPVAAVPADTLASILTADEARRMRLVKIDVEGAEAAVVEGFAPLLDGARRDLEVLVEIGPERLAKQGLEPWDIVGVFADAGFHPYVVDNSYREWRYLSPDDVRPPRRLDRAIDDELDIIFSRVDAARL